MKITSQHAKRNCPVSSQKLLQDDSRSLYYPSTDAAPRMAEGYVW